MDLWSRKNLSRMLIKYFLIYFLTLSLVLVALYLLVNFAQVNTYIAYLLVIAMAVGSNFLGMKYWVFNKECALKNCDYFLLDY